MSIYKHYTSPYKHYTSLQYGPIFIVLKPNLMQEEQDRLPEKKKVTLWYLKYVYVPNMFLKIAEFSWGIYLLYKQLGCYF